MVFKLHFIPFVALWLLVQSVLLELQAGGSGSQNGSQNIDADAKSSSNEGSILRLNDSSFLGDDDILEGGTLDFFCRLV